MTDEAMAEEWVKNNNYPYSHCSNIEKKLKQAYIAGLNAGRPEWHKIFKSDPCCVEYWDLPQDNLPKVENFYFVKLKNGFIKICELKYDHWSGRKCFYNLHGGKQSNVAEWLDYPKE